MKRKVLAITMVLTMVVAFCACGTSSDPESPSASGSPSSTPEEQMVFAVIVNDLTNAFCVSVADAAVEVFEAAGHRAIVYSEDWSAETEVQLLQDCIAMGVDGVVLESCTADGSLLALEELKAAGIPVASCDVPVNTTEEEELVISMCTTDNYRAAEMCAEDAIEQLGAENVRAVSIRYDGHPVVQLRQEGFCDVIENTPGATLLEATQSIPQTREEEMRTAEQWAQKYPDLNVVNCGGDPFMQAYVRGLEAQGIEVSVANGIYVYSVDGTQEGLQMVKDGIIRSSIVQQPEAMGALAAQDILDYIQNGAISHDWLTLFDPIWVDASNVDEYLDS